MEKGPLQQLIRKFIRMHQPQESEKQEAALIEKYPLLTQKYFLRAYAWDSLLGYGVRRLIDGDDMDPRLHSLLDIHVQSDAQGNKRAVLGFETKIETMRRNNIARYFVNTSTDGLPDVANELVSMGALMPAPQDFATAMQRHEDNFRSYIHETAGALTHIPEIIAQPYDPDEIINLLSVMNKDPFYIGIHRLDLLSLHQNPFPALHIAE